MVLGAFAGNHSLIAFRGSLHKDRDNASDIRLVELECALLHKIDKAIESLLDNLARCGVFNLSRRGTFTLRIDKGKNLMVADLFNEAIRVLEIFRCFTWEADDDVGRQGDIGSHVANLADKAQVMVARIAPVHCCENGIGARLHGKVERRHERSQRTELLDNLVGEVLRMARCEAKPLDSRLVDGIEDVGETRFSIKITAVGVHVLPEQRNFFHAGSDIALGFGDNILNRARFLATADIGNDAVGAEIVAPDGDGQPRRPGMLAACRKLGRKFG